MNYKWAAIGGVFCMALMACSELTQSAEAQVHRLGGKTLQDEDHYEPGTWDHVDAMAVDLAQLARDLHDEVHAHLRGHQYFRHIDRDSDEIEEYSEHIHELAHKGASIKHLREDVVELDEKVHHVDELITQIARRGVRAEHYDGAVRQTRRIVDAMIDILHHLEDDLVAMDPTYRTSRYRGDVHDDHRPPSYDRDDRYPARRYDDRRYDDRHYGDRHHDHMDHRYEYRRPSNSHHHHHMR